MAKNPTGWTTNPLASTANVIQYDSATEPYDSATQPYDGYQAGVSPTNWKNPTAYTPLSELYQQYYGGSVTEVPLWAAPSHWVFNPGEINQSGQYVETNSAEADLRAYDSSSTPYDGTLAGSSVTYTSSRSYSDCDTSYSGGAVVTSLNYDGVNNGKSFASWKNPTGWTPITGGGL